jgi:hypothetical protein
LASESNKPTRKKTTAYLKLKYKSNCNGTLLRISVSARKGCAAPDEDKNDGADGVSNAPEPAMDTRESVRGPRSLSKADKVRWGTTLPAAARNRSMFTITINVLNKNPTKINVLSVFARPVVQTSKFMR